MAEFVRFRWGKIQLNVDFLIKIEYKIYLTYTIYKVKTIRSIQEKEDSVKLRG